VRHWGQIGTQGQVLVEIFTNEIEAGLALEAATQEAEEGHEAL
jgi:predicted DNA-binding WGR domain protein